MWNSIKKFFGPSKRDKERIERWRELNNSDDKLTIEHFDKAVNPEEEDEMEEVQVTKHMSIKEKKSKLTIENFDEIVNTKEDKRNRRQANDKLAQHMTEKRKKKKTKPITYNF